MEIILSKLNVNQKKDAASVEKVTNETKTNTIKKKKKKTFVIKLLDQATNMYTPSCNLTYGTNKVSILK